MSGGTHATGTEAPGVLPTGLSPAPAARSSSVRLTPALAHSVRGLPPPPSLAVQPPPRIGRQATQRGGFGLLPVRSPLLRGSSLFPRGTEMFQFPRFPPGRYLFPAGSPASPRRDCSIRASSALCVASRSPRRFAARPRPSSAWPAKASTARPSIAACPPRAQRRAARRPHHAALPARGTPRWCVPPRPGLVLVSVHLSRCNPRPGPVEPRGFEPRPSAVQGRRSPSCAMAPGRGGRAWTRTRDLGLIRAAL